MKKVISVFLALIMIFSCVGVVLVSAENNDDCTCGCFNCTNKEGCHCCIYCEKLDKNYVLSCVTYDENKVPHFCCDECDGLFPCSCGATAAYEFEKNEDGSYKLDDNYNKIPKHPMCCINNYESIEDGSAILTPDQQESFITGFRSILKTIAAVFDELFNRLFEFLRVKDIFPDLMPN